ncbi:EAL domain-containing protein [Paenibacillus sp. y28]|uniref:EAL domain-containing protein n=1 Tax=Paenibacillus sp. y28 TaxID=3129110 RepID=UPI00301A3A20
MRFPVPPQLSSGLLILAAAFFLYAAFLGARWLLENLYLRRHYVKAVLDHMDDGIYIYTCQGRQRLVNSSGRKLGLPPDPAEPGMETGLYHMDGTTPLEPSQHPMARLLAGEQSVVQEMWIKPKQGPFSIVQVKAKRLAGWRGKAIGYMLITHDITKQKWDEKRLMVSEQRYKSMFEHNPDMVVWLNLDGRFLSVNPAAERLTGFTARELLEQPFTMLFHSDDRGAVLSMLTNLRNEAGSMQFEIRLQHKKEQLIDVNMTVIPITVEDRLVGAYVIAQNITIRKMAEATVQHLAYHDTLTGLPNRLLFFQMLSGAIEQSARDGSPMSLLFIDLNRFKLVNDTMGHAAGDRLLQETANRINGCLNGRGALARLSGDEFVILLQNALPADAEQLAQRMISNFSEPVTWDGYSLFVSMSIGISLYPENGSTAEQLLQFADIAMYRMKEKQQNGYIFFETEMNETIQRRMTLEKELRQAVEKKQFMLYYQPQIDGASGRISGMEALLRWLHPERGLVPPQDFIPLAEETGLIVPLGEWVLETACRQNQLWRDAGLPPITIAVNISMRQFQEERLISVVERIVQEQRLEPGTLELEITESVGLQGTEQVIEKLERIKQLGVSIAIDDFGTGYSSLHYLRRLPVDTLKIDRSFIRDMTFAENGITFVQSILSLAHSLQLNVLAEGVEHESQQLALRQLGCERMQGYYFSRPVPAGEAELLLQHEMTAGSKAPRMG